jgi:DNA polymerase-3 subunit delta'
MDIDEAYKLIERAVTTGRTAHGYLVVGGLRGMAGELAERVLRLLFGDGDLRAHPDVHRLAPEKKSRIISVDAVRTRMVNPVGATAFKGGWKAGVIYGADRLNDQSANAFLKTLEEPPPKTLFLLLTDQPERLLPTIVSRCQRIDLADAQTRSLVEPYRGEVLNVLASDRLVTATAKAAAAGRLCAVLEKLRKVAADEVEAEVDVADDGPGEEVGKDAFSALVESRYKEYRADFVVTLMSWFRDLMALAAHPPSHSAYDDGEGGAPLLNEARRGVLETRAANLSLASTLRNVEAVEEFATSLSRNMQELPLLMFLADRLRFGVREER